MFRKNRGRSLVALCSMLLALPLFAADQPAGNHSLSELSAEWMQWALSAPRDSNPLLDTTGEFADVGQSGDVWFLAGSTGSGSITRDVTIPAGKQVFFPVFNYFWVNIPELGDNPWSPEQQGLVKALLDKVVSAVHSDGTMEVIVDGQKLDNLNTGRALTPQAFTVDLPEDNIEFFEDDQGNIIAQADEGPHEAMSCGYFVLLPPLAQGQHTIEIKSSLETHITFLQLEGLDFDVDFDLDVTYQITVN